MTKLEVLCLLAARVDLMVESNLTTLEVNYRQLGYDDDERREAMREARVLSTQAARDFMAEVEALMDEHCSDTIRSLAFTTTPSANIVVTALATPLSTTVH